MKYGIVYYKDTANLGDDILTYAGTKFLPHIDYYIDREAMDLFVPDEKEYVATIVNGFYLHYPFTFQISPYILPYFIEFILQEMHLYIMTTVIWMGIIVII